MSHLLTVLADAGQSVQYLADAPDPSKGSNDLPGFDKLLKVLHWVFIAVTALCVVGVLLVAGRMAMAHRNGEGSEHFSGLAKVLIACVLASSASGIVTALT